MLLRDSLQRSCWRQPTPLAPPTPSATPSPQDRFRHLALLASLTLSLPFITLLLFSRVLARSGPRPPFLKNYLRTRLLSHSDPAMYTIPCTTLVARHLSMAGDVGAQDHIHSSPLHLTSYQGSLEAAKFLLEHATSADVRDNMGSTPQTMHMRWTPRGHTTRKTVAIELLLEHGRAARIHVEDSKGQTHFMLCQREESRKKCTIAVQTNDEMPYQYSLFHLFLFHKYPKTVGRKTAAFTLLSVAVILPLDTHGAVPPDLLHGAVYDSSLKSIADDTVMRRVKK
jgi:hypothetical protein